MKKLSIIFMITFLLTSCISGTVEPTATINTTAIPTITSTISPTPTSTPRPTITSTPSLPTTIEFTFDKSIPENIVTLVKTTVNQAYWFYVKMGCSPDFHQVTVVSHESALTVDYDGILVGWDDLTTISTNMDVRISHEMAHVMCQLAIKQDPDTGLELMWLLEGIANYFAGLERFTNTGMYSGWRGSIHDHEVGMGEWLVASNLCDFPFHSVEKDTGSLEKYFPDYPGTGEVAATLLAKTIPNGTKALISYYKYLVDDPSDVAFQQAFGKTKGEFYKQFQDECSMGFPAFYEAIPSGTPAPGTVRIQGNVKLKGGGQKLGHYVVTTCKLHFFQDDGLNTMECSPGISTKPDGSFSIYLVPGNYWIIINSTDGSGEKAWYFEDDPLQEPQCGNNFTMDKDQNVSIIIDLENINSCR